MSNIVRLVCYSPLLASILCSYFGYTVLSRFGFVLSIPLFAAAAGGILGYKCATTTKFVTKPGGPCLDTLQMSAIVQFPLMLMIVGGTIGLVVDAGLLIKWAIWG